MIFESVIKWRPFTAGELPEKKTPILILMPPGLEGGENVVANDYWCGQTLLFNQEHRVTMFCPLSEINFPEIPETRYDS